MCTHATQTAHLISNYQKASSISEDWTQCGEKQRNNRQKLINIALMALSRTVLKVRAADTTLPKALHDHLGSVQPL
jgi:hypothetical protein